MRAAKSRFPSLVLVAVLGCSQWTLTGQVDAHSKGDVRQTDLRSRQSAAPDVAAKRAPTTPVLNVSARESSALAS